MKREITVYKNELNTVPFRKFNSVEMDIFFSICSKMRNQGLDMIRFNFEDLQEISKYSNKHKDRFIKDLQNVYKKMLQLTYSEVTTKRIDYFVLFTGFSIDIENEFVEIRVNKDLEHILNKITGSFTKFELEEFTELRSSYAKTAFRLLKQYRQTGFWKVSIEDFRILLDIPQSYEINKITEKVLKPIQKELSPIFSRLQIKKVKAKKGRKIEYLEFTFRTQDDFNKRGEKTFRDDDGNYYQKDFFHLTKDEEKKIGIF